MGAIQGDRVEEIKWGQDQSRKWFPKRVKRPLVLNVESLTPDLHSLRDKELFWLSNNKIVSTVRHTRQLEVFTGTQSKQRSLIIITGWCKHTALTSGSQVEASVRSSVTCRWVWYVFTTSRDKHRNMSPLSQNWITYRKQLSLEYSISVKM